jgi:hypothetical protein
LKDARIHMNYAQRRSIWRMRVEAKNFRDWWRDPMRHSPIGNER